MKLSKLTILALAVAAMCTTSCFKMMQFSEFTVSSENEASESISKTTTRKVFVYNDQTLIKTFDLTDAKSTITFSVKDITFPAVIRIIYTAEWTSSNPMPNPITYTLDNTINCNSMSTDGSTLAMMNFTTTRSATDQPTGTSAEEKEAMDPLNYGVILYLYDPSYLNYKVVDSTDLNAE